MLRIVVQKRDLVLELARRELFDGRASYFLGGSWTFINPLVTLVGFFLVFHFIFPSRSPASGASSELFLLAGLVQWIVLSDLLVKSCQILKTHGSLVKQINFPIEALFAKAVLSSLFVQLVMTAGMYVIMGVVSGLSAVSFILWSAAMCLQAAFMLGVGLFLGSITPFVPDLAQGVGVIARMGLFVTPILYSADQFGGAVKALFYLNPFSYFAWIHQDALFSQSLATPAAWLGALVLSASSMWVGGAVFKAMRGGFTDVL